MLMRCRTILICFVTAVLFSGCAYEGVVVEKRFRPVPFTESLGIDAIYNFQLRDGAGQVHSQMVTPEVFASYRVGESFNDLQPPPVQSGKDFRTPVSPNEPQLQEPTVPLGPDPMRTRKPIDRPYHPVRTTSVHHSHKHEGKTARTAAKKHRHHHSSKLATKHHKRRRSSNA
jgi:hypothetical protein